jgi:hypothetical protein
MSAAFVMPIAGTTGTGIMSKKLLSPSEAQEQQALIDWLRLKKITHFAPINENAFSGVIRQYIKPISLAQRIIAMIENKSRAMGKRKGVSDVVVLLPAGKSLFIEMKRKHEGNESFEQQAWRTELTSLGHLAFVCHGFGEAVAIINQYR